VQKKNENKQTNKKQKKPKKQSEKNKKKTKRCNPLFWRYNNHSEAPQGHYGFHSFPVVD
jgi:hypothetical protein